MTGLILVTYSDILFYDFCEVFVLALSEAEELFNKSNISRREEDGGDKVGLYWR